MSLIVKLLITAVSNKKIRNGCFALFLAVLAFLYCFVSCSLSLMGFWFLNQNQYCYPMPNNTHVSSPFQDGRVNPVTGQLENHRGTDFPAPLGTEVLAPRSGVVVRTYINSVTGMTIMLLHPDGDYTVYKHLSRFLVEDGDMVEQGIPIGLCGSTGQSTGSHLHFEIVKDGKYVDPMEYLEDWP